MVCERGDGAVEDCRFVETRAGAAPPAILDLAHRALPIAPDDPRYGAAGDQLDCGHYYYETDTPNWLICLDPGKTPANSEIRYGEITERNLAAHVMRRLTYNPDFAALADEILDVPRRTAVAEPAEADYVIVGAGAAGCVLASRLSASGRARVLVLEAGGADRHLAIRVPAGFRYTIGNPRLNWGYKTAPGTHIGERVIDFPRGRVLGGSSSINGHLFVRGQAADYDHWAQLGCRGWSWDDVLPYFMRAETRAGRRSRDARQRRSADHLRPARAASALPGVLRRPRRRSACAPNPDYNAGEQEGTGLYQQMMRQRPALERRRRLSAPGARPRQSRS